MIPCSDGFYSCSTKSPVDVMSMQMAYEACPFELLSSASSFVDELEGKDVQVGVCADRKGSKEQMLM